MSHSLTRCFSTRLCIWFVLILLLVLGLLPGCEAEKEVRIGFIAQMSGPNAVIGQTARLALEDRIQEINNQGGIRGYQVRLITYDTQYESAQAVLLTRRLVEQDQAVAIIGPEWSGGAIEVAQTASRLQIPVIATTATHEQVTIDPQGNLYPFMFRVCFTDPYQGRMMADYVYHDLGVRKAAFITDVTSAYSVGIQNQFEKQFNILGGSIVAKQGYKAGDTDFKILIDGLQRSDAEMIIFPAPTYQDPILFTQQAITQGQLFQYFGSDGWVVHDLLSAAGQELEGTYVSSGLSVDQPQFQEYNERYIRAHGTKPSTHAYYALDALYALEYAIGVSIDQDRQPDRLSVRDTLEQMKDVPVFTGTLTMDPATHNPLDPPLLILQIRDGQFHIIKTYHP